MKAASGGQCESNLFHFQHPSDSSNSIIAKLPGFGGIAVTWKVTARLQTAVAPSMSEQSLKTSPFQGQSSRNCALSDRSLGQGRCPRGSLQALIDQSSALKTWRPFPELQVSEGIDFTRHLMGLLSRISGVR